MLLSRLGFYRVGRGYFEYPGTYQAPYDAKVFNRAIDVLSSHNFFQLNYDSSVIVTDSD